jgi:hypothetical protein
MPLVLDMVHHNPGETPFQSAFLNPEHLAHYGFNGQVFKHINCVATFRKTGVDVFPAGSVERAWLDSFLPPIQRQIAEAKARGLKVFYHIDLFVLPKRLVEHYRSEICDPETGRVLLDRPRTLELHALLFEELIERFPEVDGFIIRVGETYLFDTPHHIGNGPIPRLGPAWTPTYLYDETLANREAADPRWSQAQVEAYVKLITFLRETVCERLQRTLIFRTWDIFPDKLHAVAKHYLAVSERIEPHARLIFSIKHTALDFWRRVRVNPCLGLGHHPQIIEVQCQREYEGKGAFPNYVAREIIEGFQENADRRGLRSLLADPKSQGVYTWSRGGGWYGPYIKEELWCDLNAWVLGRFSANPALSEEQLFNSYARSRLGLGDADAALFRELCLLSSTAILKGRYCEAFDRDLGEAVLPVANWMRDDRLGGLRQLSLVIDRLINRNDADAALLEKAEAVALWNRMADLTRRIHWPDATRAEQVRVSLEYGRLLFSIVEQAWRIMILGRRHELGAELDREALGAALAAYDRLWIEYRALAASPWCASLYEPRYFGLPGATPEPGIGETVAHYAKLLAGK